MLNLFALHSFTTSEISATTILSYLYVLLWLTRKVDIMFKMNAIASSASSMVVNRGSAVLFTNLNFLDNRMRIPAPCIIRKRLFVRKSNLPTVWCSASRGSSVVAGVSDKKHLLKQARNRFCEEISFQKEDQDVSVIKAMLLISAEDELFISANREKDNLAVRREGSEVSDVKTDNQSGCLDDLHLDGKTMSSWLVQLDALFKEVAAMLSRNGRHYNLLQILKAVNTVLFETHGFSRSFLVLDPMKSYLHHVLAYRSGSVIMLSIIFMEICRKLGINMVGAEVGEDFLIWPLMEGKQAIFELPEDSNDCISKLNENSILSQSFASSMVDFIYSSRMRSNATVQLASNRDIIGIALRNLKNLYWKQACRSCPGLSFTEPLHPQPHHSGYSVGALLRPQDLRLATMASERLVLLQPHNWLLRRDHGMLLYHSRRYGEAVLELSICMALAPNEKAEVLEHFVEKLHLMRVESSWNSYVQPNTPSRLA